MALPPRVDLYWPTIAVLRQRGGSATIDEIVEGVSGLMRLGEEDASQLHGLGPRTELDYQLAWVRTELKNAGVLANSQRRVWSLTTHGRELTQESIRLVLEPARSRTDSSPAGVLLDPVLVDDWKDSLLESIMSIPPDAFERLAQRVLRERGFDRVKVEGRSGDGGIDGRGVLRLSLIGLSVVFQCKRQRAPVGPDVVRELRGSVHGRADRGLLITTSRFTAGATEEATRTAPSVELIDGDDLCEILKETGLGVVVERVERVRIDPSFFAGI